MVPNPDQVIILQLKNLALDDRRISISLGGMWAAILMKCLWLYLRVLMVRIAQMESPTQPTIKNHPEIIRRLGIVLYRLCSHSLRRSLS
ncbi:MAG: hypothetical protein F6K30_23630 [Cyanothece sp. SIO2G6]|nr:hypothetical protein [Cyanothece sp. SIO2G6]